MDIRQMFYKTIQNNNVRLTKPRIAIIKILEKHHLTFKQLYLELVSIGYKNIATLYNNIDFLIINNIITELFISGTKYYDLVLNNNNHQENSHIHLLTKVKDLTVIDEINDPGIFSFIKDRPEFRDKSISYIQISIGLKNNKDSE
jgi:Fur family ferric uptake transcriptional regulator/Fur family peroxide stress response transcriptional regulator